MAEFIRELKRTNSCGELTSRDVGREVVLFGWVHHRRDHGGAVFIDLRDRAGITQVVFEEDVGKELSDLAHELRLEYCLGVRGKVVSRGANANPKLVTGEIEVHAIQAQIFNRSETPPFLVEDRTDTAEEKRLAYRYLDLRRPAAQRPLLIRSRMNAATRRVLHERGFLELETPFLVRYTPGGARNFLVPSRLSPGKFYALAESPQLFKQLFMVSGFDRYFQIVKCFRDEDLRLDRQPEFTQIDIEMSFVDEREIRPLMEGLVRAMFNDALGVALPDPFPVMTFADVMRDYGSDKPDLRVPLKLTELTDLMNRVDFKVFRSAADEAGGRVAALRVPRGGELTRKEIDDYSAFVSIYGAKGLAYIKVNDKTKPNEEGLQSPIVKFLPTDVLSAILERSGAETGDVIFFGAGRERIVNDALGALRAKIGHDRGFVEPGWRPLWVVDFPMFEYDEDRKSWAARHHPFTAPKDGHEGLFGVEPAQALAKAYDVVLNGWEIGGGSVRIHSPEVQQKVFAALGISPEDQRRKFGFLLDALQYGAPPHGGIAFGLDRTVALMCGVDSIRDVIAFPKTQRGQDLLVDTPTPIGEQQLRELHIRVRASDASPKDG